MNPLKPRTQANTARPASRTSFGQQQALDPVIRVRTYQLFLNPHTQAQHTHQACTRKLNRAQQGAAQAACHHTRSVPRAGVYPPNSRVSSPLLGKAPPYKSGVARLLAGGAEADVTVGSVAWSPRVQAHGLRWLAAFVSATQAL
jgi:hypothetical protein